MDHVASTSEPTQQWALVNTTPKTLQTNSTLQSEYWDHIDSINKEAAQTLGVVIAYISLMMFLGISGNLLVVYVYGFRWQRNKFRVFVTSLAVLDLINSIISMPIEIIMQLNWYYFDYPKVCRGLWFTCFAMYQSSSAIICILIVDRFLMVYYPTKTFIDVKRAKVSCIVATLLCCVLSLPVLAIYGNNSNVIQLDGMKIQSIICNVSDHMVNTWLAHANSVLSYVLVAFGITTVVLLNLLISIKIWTMDRRRVNCTQRRAGEKVDTPSPNISTEMRKALAILTLISVVTVVSFIPYTCTSIIMRVKGLKWYISLQGWKRAFFVLFRRSYMLSNSLNPLIYGFFHNQFRRECAKIMRRLSCRNV